MSTPQHTRWTIVADEKEVPIVGPPVDNDVNALQLGKAVSLDRPESHIRVVGWFRTPDGWDSGINLGQFRAGELLPVGEWT